MKTSTLPPHQLVAHPTLGELARHLNAVDVAFQMLQEPVATREMWLLRIAEDAETLAQVARNMLRRGAEMAP
jgi:hypothetical protein